MNDLINGEIPDHWEFTTLGEVCRRGGGNIQTGPFGSQLHASDYVAVGVPSIMPTNIGENRIVEEGIVRITEDDANRLAQHRVRYGDILYSRRGDVEKRALIREHEEGWFCGTGCLKVRLGTGVVDPLFASLFLGHPSIREWIVRHAIGATMPNLNTSIMSAVPFAVPPLAEQKAIAAVLGSLDDKIELNRRINTTLEAMARALFQNWFVNFDPVREKVSGRKPKGMDAATTALFPASFQDSPLGKIPKGWKIGRLDEVASVFMGLSPKGDTYNSEAIAVLLEKHEVLLDLFHGFDLDAVRNAKAAKQLGLIKAAMDYVLGVEHGKQRFLQTVTELSKAFAISVPNEKALKIRDDVALFQTIRAQIIKHTVSEGKSVEELDSAIRQIISKAIVSEGIVDIYGAAGLKKPDISVLDDKFLDELRGMPHKNLALETLRKLLNDEIKLRSQKNLVQSKAFSEMLETAIRRYQNRAIETAQVIDELIRLAKDMRQAHKRGEELGLSDDEVAFYDALETNDSAVKVLGDKNLKIIARELVETVKKNTSIDWTEKESVRAKLRSVVRRILRKYGYPPDKQEKATQTVLEQAALLSKDWVAV